MSDREELDRLQEPTAEQCTNKNRWKDESFDYVAFWWPQMGGYCAKAIAKVLSNRDEDNNCVDVWVWHRGDFPFTEGARDFNDNVISPAELHICDFEDWKETLTFLSNFQNAMV